MVEKVVIIGSGPAGLSAAIYTSREGFEPLVIAGSTGGGQLELTTTVENFPGFPEGVLGPELVQLMKKQAEKFGTRFVYEDLTGVDFSARPFVVQAGEKRYETESIIIATGANAKMLGIESEKKFVGKGVSTCGTCDGPFFKGKDVIVVGGGDTAMEDSNFITKFARSVTIVHRKDTFRASKIMQERTFANSRIKVIWNATVEEILGNERVTGVRLKNLVTGQTSEMPIDGVFMAIGYSPNTKVFQGKLKLDEQGYIITKDEVLTDIEGVYVAGDVADRFYRQAITASGSGVKCALHVREYLADLAYKRSKQG
ncbi:MAG TPA: thioredoxin-disulfide reductase [Candidatus Saccharimonadales bacterium]|nr:thioredoxin-disulfide reductase [Candidatus Saccharimonadales bacterium]